MAVKLFAFVKRDRDTCKCFCGSMRDLVVENTLDQPSQLKCPKLPLNLEHANNMWRICTTLSFSPL